jgi:maltose alpha-D-glucosyltransferase / alpha-amylase
MIDLWYKDAIVYELDVKTFQDSNGDGIGDLPGLTRRLPYIAGLGATCIWLRPFFPSPLRDDGYDVTDYYAIDPRLGTFGEFVEFLSQARELGLRVLTDLVLNHTSVDHPWFQSACRDRNSPYRDWYLWSDEKPPGLHEGMAFPGLQQATWKFNAEAGAWYHHRFFWHQPDLNTANPSVRREIGRIIGFWLSLGLSGFRMDAVPFMLEHRATEGGPPRLVKFSELQQQEIEGAYELLRDLRLAVSWRRGDAILLAEANVTPDLVREYFGPGADRMHMLFNFLLTAKIFLALARQQAEPLASVLEEIPGIPEAGQWLNFLRNHDELNLNHLDEQERHSVFEAFAPEESMRVYGRGIRRRPAPMLGDRRRVELAHALMLSLPGTPLIRYGDEIGMGEDLDLSDRLAVRTPMQWSSNKNGGFSDATADRLIRPVVRGPFGPKHVNVTDQQHDPDSLLERVERMIRVRKQCREISHGRLTRLDAGDPAVFAHRCEWDGGAAVFLHNLADRPAKCRGEPARHGECLAEILADQADLQAQEKGISLAGYGYRWFRVQNGREIQS